MHVEFAGAAQEVTGSCHLVTVGTETIALDFGLFQGRRQESRAKNLELPVEPDKLDAVVLSHAHIDHSGRLPFLVRSGFKGTIWATAATRDLCAVMLTDSASIQESDADFLSRRKREFVPPLYTVADASDTLQQMVGVPYDRSFQVTPNIRARFIEAGHILGSASVELDCTEDGSTQRLVFSGDIGRAGLPIIRDPVAPSGARTVIMESTYGNRLHGSVDQTRGRLGEIVSETAARGGRVLIPAFAVGRTQEIVYELHVLAREGRIPEIPIYIDSPLATNATSVFELHPDVFDRNEKLVQDVGRLFRFPLVRFTRDVSESKALNSAKGPMVIIAASGMVEAGRILHHLAHGAGDPRNTVLIVGFQAEHTLGRRIVEKRETIKVFGEEIPLRARVEVLNGYSAHADRDELVAWLDAVKGTSPDLERVFLVHGEHTAQEEFAALLRSRSYDVDVPPRGAVRVLR